MERENDKMELYKVNTDGILPDACYVKMPYTDAEGIEVGIVKRGEKGYYKTPYSGDEVDNMNEMLGVTKSQAAAMYAGSMFGWDVPAANPALYDENGQFK